MLALEEWLLKFDSMQLYYQQILSIHWELTKVYHINLVTPHNIGSRIEKFRYVTIAPC